MIRIITIILISFISLVPYLVIFNRWLDIGNDLAGWVSMVLAWLVTPFLLLLVWKVKPNLEVMPVDMDDPIMQALMVRARSELNRFIEGLEEGKKEAYIKFPYEFSGEIEHVWGLAHSYSHGQFVVSLASEPVGEMSHELNSRIKIAEGQLEDWTLTDSNGDIQGGYTMLAMAKLYEKTYGKLPKAYAKEMARFVDFNWPENK